VQFHVPSQARWTESQSKWHYWKCKIAHSRPHCELPFKFGGGFQTETTLNSNNRGFAIRNLSIIDEAFMGRKLAQKPAHSEKPDRIDQPEPLILNLLIGMKPMGEMTAEEYMEAVRKVRSAMKSQNPPTARKKKTK
jgi:hypothetical protein